MNLIFEDPPQIPNGAPHKWRPIFEELKQHPNAWANLADLKHRGQAHNIKKIAAEVAQCDGTFEVVTRKIEGQPLTAGSLYARYIPNEEA